MKPYSSWQSKGRKLHYTARGIKRVACIRCGQQAAHQWQICADGNRYRPLCIDCDISLNELVLKWAQDPNWYAKMQLYKCKARGETK